MIEAFALYYPHRERLWRSDSHPHPPLHNGLCSLSYLRGFRVSLNWKLLRLKNISKVIFYTLTCHRVQPLQVSSLILWDNLQGLLIPG